MPTELNLPPIQRGDTTPYSITWSDGQSPINVAGKTLIMTFKVSNFQEDAEATLTKTVIFSPEDVDAQNGITQFTLASSETALLMTGLSYSYALRLVTSAEPENIELTYFYGTVLCEDS